MQSARATSAQVVRAEPAGAAPEHTEDEPSDGVIKTPIAAADTARLARARQRPPTPEHDGPPQKEATGEIRERKPRETKEPPLAEPSILVADLAAAHEAIAAVASKAAATPPPADAASSSRELAVSETRRDAVAFSDTEEAFFNRAERTAPAPKLESFDDLDEGYQPAGFWDRVFGRKKPPKP